MINTYSLEGFKEGLIKEAMYFANPRTQDTQAKNTEAGRRMRKGKAKKERGRKANKRMLEGKVKAKKLRETEAEIFKNINDAKLKEPVPPSIQTKGQGIPEATKKKVNTGSKPKASAALKALKRNKGTAALLLGATAIGAGATAALTD